MLWTENRDRTYLRDGPKQLGKAGEHQSLGDRESKREDEQGPNEILRDQHLSALARASPRSECQKAQHQCNQPTEQDGLIRGAFAQRFVQEQDHQTDCI